MATLEQKWLGQRRLTRRIAAGFILIALVCIISACIGLPITARTMALSLVPWSILLAFSVRESREAFRLMQNEPIKKVERLHVAMERERDAVIRQMLQGLSAEQLESLRETLAAAPSSQEPANGE